ncbi:MAG: hypothetical protein QGG40_19305, partial [Myxococcota bacterium]|nr:hypothetical protein [Myxococcota bacterium]
DDGQVLQGRHAAPALLLAWGGRTHAPERADNKSSGPGIDRDLENEAVPGASDRPAPSVFDLAPTMYALLGLPGALDMPGRPLDELMDLQRLPPVDSYRVREPPPPQPTLPDAEVKKPSPGAEADGRIRAQLEALGYLDSHGAETTRSTGSPDAELSEPAMEVRPEASPEPTQPTPETPTSRP